MRRGRIGDGPGWGQRSIYAGTVNGTRDAPVITPETFNTWPYYPFNLRNLDTVDLGAGPGHPGGSRSDRTITTWWGRERGRRCPTVLKTFISS